MRRKAAALLLACCSGHAAAQLSTPDPDWKETEAPAPPALRTTGLIPLELERTELRWGVDPASVSVGGDGIVRYVVVATGVGGATNAFYEGVRCSTAQVKVYARHTPGSGWVPAPDAQWRPLHGSGAVRHSLAIARNGACIGHGTGRTAEQVVRDLRLPPDSRFRNEYR